MAGRDKNRTVGCSVTLARPWIKTKSLSKKGIKMIIETNAYVMGFQNIHSNKNGKDYIKLNFCVDGNYCGFIVPKEKGEQIVKKCKQFETLAKTAVPQSSKLYLRLDLSERGAYVGFENLE